MNDRPLTIGLVLPGPTVADVIAVPEAVLRRMARRGQYHAVRTGLTGPCEAELRLLPERGAPGLAAAMQFTLTGDGMTFVAELPTSALAPLTAGPAADLLHASGLPADTSVSYVVLRPRDDPDGSLWTARLPAFTAVPTAGRPVAQPLLPAYAWSGDAAIVITDAALADCAAWCRGGNGEVEQGGALLGCLRRAEGTTELWVEVVAFAPAEGAVADRTHLTFTAAAWASIQRARVAVERALGLAQPLAVVGWAHGHPRAGETGASALFLSAYDAAIMAQHFAEPFACAIVLDGHAAADAPIAESLAVFGWDACGVSLIPRSVDVVSAQVTGTSETPVTCQRTEEDR